MTSTDRSYFEEMYRDDTDPWGFENSPYEQRKYAVTVASLPNDRYHTAYEPGCSVGVLSEMLATRCDNLFSSDIIPAALDRAAQRLRGQPHVRIQELCIPDQWPPGPFDLVVLSEIAYYFEPTELGRVMARVMESTVPGAHVVGVHWLGQTNYPLTGECTNRIIGRTRGLHTLVHHRDEEFVLDVWQRQ